MGDILEDNIARRFAFRCSQCLLKINSCLTMITAKANASCLC